ncbi:hypothetical protein ABPG75_010102 [Micractinium tetrahymenae]
MAAEQVSGEPGSLAAALPADLLHRIFCTADARAALHGRQADVLSFEERAQAEAVCKHWRAALSSRPTACQSLVLGRQRASPSSLGAAAPAEPAASTAKAQRLAEAVAARAPVVQHIKLIVHARDCQQLSDAVIRALRATFAHQGSRTLEVLLHSDGLERRLAAYLAAAVTPPCASLARLELRLSHMRGDLHLAPAQLGFALPSLPHVRQLLVQSTADCAVVLSLPMLQLESLKVQALKEQLGPVPAQLVALGLLRIGLKAEALQRGSGAPLFPLLARADIDSAGLSLDAAAAPNLAALKLQLFLPGAYVIEHNLLALTRLTHLDLISTTIFSDACLGKLGEGEPADTAVYSNCFAPLLAWHARCASSHCRWKSLLMTAWLPPCAVSPS